MKKFFSGSAAMFLLGVSLASGLAFSAYIVANGFLRAKRGETITVKGSADMPLFSDRGYWNGSISVTAKNLADGYAMLEKDRALALDFLSKEGFSSSEITVEQVRFSPNYKRNDKGEYTNGILDYELSQSLLLRTGKVEKLPLLARRFTELLKSGVRACSYDPTFEVSDIESHKMKLLAAATANGAERANVLLGGRGRLGKLVFASQGVFQVLAPGAGNISSEGTYDRSSMEKVLKAVVTLEFVIE